MPVYIVKLEKGKQKQYMLWSTIVDAPTCYGMKTHDEVAQELQYRGQYTVEFPERMERVESTGTSAIGWTVKELFDSNRAGPKESCLTPEEILAQYWCE